MDRGGHLAVGPLAQRAAVLPLDADGVPPLLGEAGVVDDEQTAGIGEGLGHDAAVAPPDVVLVPGALVDELLQGLVGVGDVEVEAARQPADHRLDALAFAVGEQSVEIDAAPGGLPGAIEGGAEALGVGVEAVEDIGRQYGGVGSVHIRDTNRTDQPFV